MVEEEIGEVTHYFTKIGVAVVRIKRGELRKGDRIAIKGKTTNFQQVVNSMQIHNKDIEVAKAGDEIGLKVEDRVREKDIVYKITE
ncbi:MAG: EF-Tu/IF-2/RF-3 family GTPase [Candidatus Micrarchaeia archaeon]|jgi:putative protease